MSVRPPAHAVRPDVPDSAEDSLPDAYGSAAGSMLELSGFDLPAFDSETAAEGFERARPGLERRHDDEPPVLPAGLDRLPAERIEDDRTLGDDLPDAFVGDEEGFFASLDLVEEDAPPTPRRAPRPAPEPAAPEPAAPEPAAPAPPRLGRPTSVGAAAALLQTMRDRHAERIGSAFDASDDGDFETLADGPLPPRGRKRSTHKLAERGSSGVVAPSRLLLATLLAIPALGLGLHLSFSERQSTRAEWREAFNGLDDLTNGFAAIGDATEPAWADWQKNFEQTRPTLEAMVQGAPESSAGGQVEQALVELDRAAVLRSGGAPPEATKEAFGRSVKHAQGAAARLGLFKREWAQ